MNKMLCMYVCTYLWDIEQSPRKLLVQPLLLFHTSHVLLDRPGSMEDESYSQDGEQTYTKVIVI